MTDRKHFFGTIRAAWGPLTQSQVDGLTYLLDAIDADIDAGRLAPRQAAYLLATAKHETANTYLPIEERGSRAYLSKYYLVPSKRRSLGNLKLSDAWTYKGRGYVQITGRRNYTSFRIAENPDAALEPATAYRIMRDGMMSGAFGVPLGQYVARIGVPDFVNARRSVNGTDKAAMIAGYADVFWKALKQLPGTVTVDVRAT